MTSSFCNFYNRFDFKKNLKFNEGGFKVVYGFTLIELLVVISIIGIISAISLFALQGSRESGRNARRQADLETIRSALEMYKADCNVYPASLPSVGSSLTGVPGTTNCAGPGVSVTYLSSVPGDPSSSGSYSYTVNASRQSYTLCAHLEGSSASVSGCGSCNPSPCRYRVTSP